MTAAFPIYASARMSTNVPRKYVITGARTASELPTPSQGGAHQFFAPRIGCHICNTNGKARCGDTGLYVSCPASAKRHLRGRLGGQDGEIVTGSNASSQAIWIRHPALTVLSTDGRMGA